MTKRRLGLAALAAAIVAVALLSVCAINASAGVTYEDPAGWTLEVIKRVDYASLDEYRAVDALFEAHSMIQAMVPGDYKLAREMGCNYADYLYCLIDVPRGARSPSFGILDHFVAVLDDSTRVRSRRVLSTESMEQRHVYDSSRTRLTLGGYLRIARDQETNRVVCFLHFPIGTVDPEALVRLELHQLKGGDFAWCD